MDTNLKPNKFTTQPKIHNSVDSSKPYGRLSENPKTWSSRELFLPENDSKACSTVNFPKNIQILENWKPTKDMKFRLAFFYTCPSIYELNVIQKLFWTLMNILKEP